jgi:hypothetical protein
LEINITVINDNILEGTLVEAKWVILDQIRYGWILVGLWEIVRETVEVKLISNITVKVSM